jgi:Ca-activated chloride channel family protein
VYKRQGQFIEPDSSIILRFHVKPKKTGKFNYQIELFTSDKLTSTIFELTGNQLELAENQLAYLQSCPDFGVKPSSYSSNFKLNILVIDQATKAPLRNSSVSIIQNGAKIGTWETNSQGKISEKIPPGFTYFYVSNALYLPTELGKYTNINTNTICIELAKNPAIGPLIPSENKLPKLQISDSIPAEKIENLVPLEIALKEEILHPIATNQPVKLDTLPFENFNEAYFKPVNVVFVLDKSSSMLTEDKLELMKYALFQLTDYLRPIDKIGVVTYSSTAKILIPPTSGNNKETIKKPISKIHPGGGTAGADGIKLGYEQVNLAYIPDGTNMVILITDGAFNKNTSDYQSIIDLNKSKGITFSVVGIKNLVQDEIKMKQAAQLGNGNYVPIFKLADAQFNLIQQIRISSFRTMP